MGELLTQAVGRTSTYPMPMEENIEISRDARGRNGCDITLFFNTNSGICYKILVVNSGMGGGAPSPVFFSNQYRYYPLANKFEYKNAEPGTKPCPMDKDSLKSFLEYLKEARVKIEEKYKNGQYTDRKISDLIDNAIKETESAIAKLENNK